MCSECRQSPCHPRCPNAEEPPIYSKCEICGEPIYDGDEFYQIDDHDYCESCVFESYKTAEVDF